MDCLFSILKALRQVVILTFDQNPVEQQPSTASFKKGYDGRMVTNGWNHVASLFTQKGDKGINQDAMVVLEVCA